MPAHDANDRALLARIAAHERWAREPDRTAATAKARQASLDRFERQVDPDGILPPEERARRAAHARSAYFARLALQSARVRRQKRQLAEEERRLEAELAGMELGQDQHLDVQPGGAAA